MPCPAIKQNGDVCGKRCREGQEFCGVHLNARRRNPAVVLVPAPADVERRRQAQQWRIERRRAASHLSAITRINRALIERTGYSLGPNYIRNRAFQVAPGVLEPWRTYFEGLFPRINQIIADIYNGVPNAYGQAVALAAVIERDAPPRGMVHIPIAPQGELARFVQDRQNVHTEAAVRQTKDVIARVLRIPVPAEYRSPSIKTMAEIMAECPLSKKAAWQFASKYCADEDIYEYGPGVYARVADCVWQYVKHSSDKADLCRIFAAELQDSVGMCAQGNLTRLCNVLAGYLEGVNMESPGEQLQRRMAEISKGPNSAIRIEQGIDVLRELAVPEAEWQVWLDALA